MQLTVKGKKYTICYTVAATLCDDLLETVTRVVGASAKSNDETEQSIGIAGQLPNLTKSLMYGGLLQFHGEYGDNTIRSKKDAEKLLFDYITENSGKSEGTLSYIFNMLYKQMDEDNFFARIGLTEEQETATVTPISRGRKKDGGEN